MPHRARALGARTTVGIALPMAVRGGPSRQARQGQMKGSGTEAGHELVRWGMQGKRRLREVRLKLGLDWSEFNSDGVQAFRNG